MVVAAVVREDGSGGLGKLEAFGTLDIWAPRWGWALVDRGGKLQTYIYIYIYSHMYTYIGVCVCVCVCVLVFTHRRFGYMQEAMKTRSSQG